MTIRMPPPSASVTARVRAQATLEDLGLRVRSREAQAEGPRLVIVESEAGLLDDRRPQRRARRCVAAGLAPQPVFTYLANTMRVGDREIPYSLVTATDLATVAPGVDRSACRLTDPAIVLNDWAARDLQARVGDRAALEYYVWEEPGQLVTRSADFRRRRPSCRPTAGDRDLAPRHPRHQRFADARRLGPAVPDRPAPHSPRGRGLLGRLPDDAEGVRRARDRAAAVAIALRRDDVDPRCRAAGRRARPPRRHRSSARLRAALDPLAPG